MKLSPVAYNDLRSVYGFYSGTYISEENCKKTAFHRNLYNFFKSLFFILHPDNDEVINAFDSKVTVEKLRQLEEDEKIDCHFEFKLEYGDDIDVYFQPSPCLLAKIETFYRADIENFSAHLQNKDTFTEYDIIEEHREIEHARMVERRSNEYMSIINELESVENVRIVIENELKKLGLTDEKIKDLEKRAFLNKESFDANKQKTYKYYAKGNNGYVSYYDIINKYNLTSSYC